ncbi:MAG: FecR domain-containing protein [Sphingobacteriia bacterium]|nr:FecR domain-containing protein [Sphingobacteriia bacterium]
MSENPVRLKILFERYICNELSPAEQLEFWELVKGLDEKDLIDEELKQLWERERGTKASDRVNWARVEEKLQKQILASEIDYSRFVPRPVRWWKYAAAAVVIGVMVLVGKQLITNKTGQPTVVAKTDIAAPNKSRAVITLADGQTVYVDQVKAGEKLVVNGGLEVIKNTDGSVVYQVKDAEALLKDGIIPYHIFSNPKGSVATAVRLVDGSVIWLNAGSSVKYPMAYVAGRKREVELLAGEAFFDVRHDAKSPLVLKAGNELIEDLGTSFNVNAYSKEQIKTTLVDGALRVNATDIQPGEQYENGRISKPELEGVTAWKNGQFVFQATSVEDIMKQAAVWYDIEVVQDAPIRERFTFSVDRNKPVSALLKAMELSGGVHFEIKGRTVHVAP